MSSPDVIARPWARAATGPGRPFTPIGLGFLSLVPVLVVALAQFLQIGFGLTLASAVPISDTNVWSGCASALSHLTTPGNLDWCLKRPSQMFLQAPLFLASPNSMAAAIVVQTLILSALMWWLLVTITHTLPVTRSVMWVVYVASLWPVALYGTQLGTESPALALSCVSATAFLRMLSTRRILWGFASGATALLAFQMRPGNIFLTGAIAVGVLYLAWRKTRRWLVPAAVLVGFFLIWWLPDQVLRMAGWSEAGHSSNFWSVLYSAASPDNDTWEAAYVRFAQQVGCSTNWNPDPCMGLESSSFADLLRHASLQLIQQNPLAIPRQMVTNLTTMLDVGFLNQMWVNPFPPIWRASLVPEPWAGTNALGILMATVMWAISWGLLALIIVALVKWRRNAAWRRDRVLHFGASAARRLHLTLALGLVTIIGSIVFFALVGHDEPQRHMVQNIPFVLLALAAVIAIFWPGPGLVQPGSPLVEERASTATAQGSRWPSLVLAALVGAIALIAVVEGHRSGQTLQILRSCAASGQEPQEYLVVGKASWHADASVDGPSDWRVLQGRTTQSFPSGFSWPQSQINGLPPGMIMSLRSLATGDVIPVFLADSLNTGDVTDPGTVWCTRIPSQYSSIIVHDLERYAPDRPLP